MEVDVNNISNKLRKIEDILHENGIRLAWVKNMGISPELHPANAGDNDPKVVTIEAFLEVPLDF